MQILLDTIIAFLSCVGIWALWELVTRHLHYDDISKDEKYEWMKQ